MVGRVSWTKFWFHWYFFFSKRGKLSQRWQIVHFQHYFFWTCHLRCFFHHSFRFFKRMRFFFGWTHEEAIFRRLGCGVQRHESLLATTTKWEFSKMARQQVQGREGLDEWWWVDTGHVDGSWGKYDVSFNHLPLELGLDATNMWFGFVLRIGYGPPSGCSNGKIWGFEF